MSYAQTLLPEFDQEMANTRKVLERIPEDRLDWQPHPKSHTIGWNANHITDLPNWLFVTLTQPSLDIAPVGGDPLRAAETDQPKRDPRSLRQECRGRAKALTEAKDEDMARMWSLERGGQPLLTMPRSAVVRGLVLNHLVHHRAILCVYLRMNDIPVPGMYGPSGDE